MCGQDSSALRPNPKDRKSFCGTIGAPPMRSFGRKPRFPRMPPSALRGNIKQSENGPSGPRRQSGADFQAIHLPKIYTITWGPRKNRVFVGKCCEFPPRDPATLHSWGCAPPFGHPRLRRPSFLGLNIGLPPFILPRSSSRRGSFLYSCRRERRFCLRGNGPGSDRRYHNRDW